MKRLLGLIVLICNISFAQSGQPYQIYNAKGKKVTYKKMIRTLAKQDVVLFGEFHNNSLGHWLQLKVTEDLGSKRQLVLGAEMFEADNQVGVSNYVSGKIDESKFKEDVRLWNNYVTDYKPLIEYAKANQLNFVATNVPRRYASIVFKQGVEALDTLSLVDKSWIAPLPFPYDSELPGYKKMMSMFDDKDHANDNFPKAQAIKDATMGYFISQNLLDSKLFVHYNGSFHSDYFDGIYWYINKYSPGKRINTITMVESDNVGDFENDNLDRANFIIVIHTNILKSF
ncbi:ChaN family lipoprotein [Myroides sp. LoEW2-1]|uniref:ChaN family lipoprotein n=1 Tax=Myroides sp. LoEW2-1 TaxID=2683192 RepID=UPI001322E820|nr:ChaN family lipoprotein [Myroides sp. LoEW2-1]MVX35061.1 iron-regulated protein [Myroides sp. LoEW2-1]